MATILNAKVEITYNLTHSSITFTYIKDNNGEVFTISTEGDNEGNAAIYNSISDFENNYIDFKNKIKNLKL